MNFSCSSLADVPFIAMLNDTAPQPLMLSAILPGMDLVILRGQPTEGTPMVTDDDIRAAALRAMEIAVEESEKEAGAGRGWHQEYRLLPPLRFPVGMAGCCAATDGRRSAHSLRPRAHQPRPI